MTQHLKRIGKATTAIATVLALSSTPSFAQEAPPAEVDTSVETPAPADPLAPTPSAADQAVPPAPQPKVETTAKATATASTERATRTAARSPARSTPRRLAAASPAPAAEAPVPAPLPAEPQPSAMPAAPPPPPIAEPAPAATATDTAEFDLTSPDTLPIVAAGALGLLAVGGAALIASRRRRRREDEEFEDRQQALAAIEDEPALELGSTDEVQPAPAFVRAPIHDPVPAGGVRTKIPAQGNWDPAPDFMFRPAGKNAKAPVDH